MLRVFRVGLLTVALLLIVQLFVPTVLEKAEDKSPYAKVLENNFRFGDKVEKTALEALIYHMKQTGGYKVAFIGDSVVAGATVKNPSRTIPAYFKELAAAEFPDKAIHVYNLAMPGNRSSDIYFTYRMIEQSGGADLIIMNLNYAFYSGEMLNEALIARPDLYTNVMDSESARQLGIKYSPVEGFLRTKVASLWNIYSMREELSYFLFGKNPREIVTGLHFPISAAENTTPAKTSDETDFRNWKSSRPFPADKLEHWVQVFNVKPLDSANKGFWFLERQASEIRRANSNTIVFLTPVNSDMVKDYQLLRYGKHYNENMLKIADLLKQDGIPVFDYTNAINPDYFHDLFHMGPDGNRRVAELLAGDLRDNIKKELSR